MNIEAEFFILIRIGTIDIVILHFLSVTTI